VRIPDKFGPRIKFCPIYKRRDHADAHQLPGVLVRTPNALVDAIFRKIGDGFRFQQYTTKPLHLHDVYPFKE